MSFIQRILEPPSYGFERDGALYVPTHAEIFREFFKRLNVFRDRRNWLPFWGWAASVGLCIPFFVFVFQYATIGLLVIAFVYSMVVMGSHGTFWLHRYSTHRAYQFRNPLIRAICRNLVIKIIPEEVYVISHFVHHQISEKPGDPYNVHGGWLYCFLADVNHQLIRRDLTEAEYAKVAQMIGHTGVRQNSYAQYLKWGSICHPGWTLLHYAANWAFWYGALFLLGGHALALCFFAAAAVWGFGVRTFNFDGHGRGVDRRREGVDFNTKDWSINHWWVGYVAGEWHNNHHLYPNASRSGFLPHQIDLPWLFVKGLASVGAVHSFREFREEFYRDHYLPYVARIEESTRLREAVPAE
ncbi:MAG TPA: fatty acid desaturase [Bdellovibrionota bacterium]|nr:fatty acid desaturase [Bdellovibrionota bacterium]